MGRRPQPQIKDRLLDTCADYVLAHGLPDRLEPLAAAAGTSARMLIYHFGTRDALLRAVLGRARQRQLAAWGDLLRARPGEPYTATLSRAWAAIAGPAGEPYLRTFGRLRESADQRLWPDFRRAATTDWLGPLEDGLRSIGRPELATLVLAVIRGLLMDLDATGDAARADRAFRDFLGAVEHLPGALREFGPRERAPPVDRRRPAGDSRWVTAADAIARIDTFPLRIPFRAGPGKPRPPVDSLLVKVTTEQGREGWGEAFGFEATPVTRRAVEDLIAPLCEGRDPAQIGPLMRSVQEKLQVFGRAGAVIHALSAVDTALWDIAGKAAGMPLHRLLGGGAASLPCYASLDPYGDPEAVRAGVRQALGAGFTAVKLHEREVTAVRAARAEAGQGTALMLDVNCPWTLGQARAAAEQLREARLRWLEEPLWPPEDFAGLARLRAGCGIPVAAGENTATLLDFGRLMDAVDIVQPSPAKMGGVTELCKVFQVAAARGVTAMPHTFYHGPGLLAAVHVTAALGAADAMIEWRFSDLEALPYGDALLPERGRIRVPPGPGLGIDPDPGVLRHFAAA